MEIIKPPCLQEGGIIGIISPAQSVMIDPIQTKGFDKGIERLKNFGFHVKIAPHAKGRYFYSAGTPQERADDFHQMTRDKEVRAILMSIGGETANEVLPLLDFDLIKKNPKIIIGMSDGATLLSPITDKTGIITFYGPDLIYGFGLCQGAGPFHRQILDCLMEGRTEFRSLKGLRTDGGVKIASSWKRIRAGKTKGRLIGGYLEVINSLVASGYLKNLKGKILYLESMEGSHTIHMRLQYSKLLGIFDRIAGLILGYFPDIRKDKKYYRPIEDIVLELTSKNDFPILQVNELGHGVNNYAWPNGLLVDLDASGKEIIALENCTA